MVTARNAPSFPNPPSPLPPGQLRDRAWKRFLRGPDAELLDDLYVPALGEALRYDRCCAYFSSSVLAAAARGFGRLIERHLGLGENAPRPAVRLVVNEELPAPDVRALTETRDLTDLEEHLLRRFTSPADALARRRLEMLAWLVRQDLLEIRVGVMRSGEGIVHAKFGVISDELGDAVVFSGSGNESAHGLYSNYERLDVSTSWEDAARYREYADEFEALWTDTHPDVHTVTLPEAVRLRLIRLAPREAPTVEPSTAIARQQAAMRWRFIIEAPYLPDGAPACDATAPIDYWPHQRRVVEETASAWPSGRLLCDEVGLGKTIEAVLILRRLLAGRGVCRALLLTPAGLLQQWQEELREKGGLVVPRLEPPSRLVWPDGREEKLLGLAEVLARDVLLMSRETARTEINMPLLLAAPPWDLVLLDEAHAARRREQEESESNAGTLLLTLLRELQLRRRTRSLLLISATPMQTHPWEPWDLLAVLGEGAPWLAEFGAVRRYYDAIDAVRRGACSLETARAAAVLIAADPAFPPGPFLTADKSAPTDLVKQLVFAPATQREAVAEWLHKGSPLSRRMHRSTRETLRHYHALGLLPHAPPRRTVDDIIFDYVDPAERAVYDAVSIYIERRFERMEGDRTGKGFVQTIYRRRASSSPLSLQRSLERRREGLRRIASRLAPDFNLSAADVPEGMDPLDLPEGDGPVRVSAAYPQDPSTARAELVEVERLLEDLRALAGRDSKRDCFFDQLRRLADEGRPILIFTEYVDTMNYLREALAPYYGTAIGSFSGVGGARWDGAQWNGVTKSEITASLQAGELRMLVCTDAASEGLNLQAAGALLNYDLPWNPSKVEQRIGRIDRIGQRLPIVRIVNLFLQDSVDDRVYRALRMRCGLFEHFVGAMQPVLARARRMLLGQDPIDIGALEATAAEVELDPLAVGTYIESPAEAAVGVTPAITRGDLVQALRALPTDFGMRVRTLPNATGYRVTRRGLPPLLLSDDPSVLDANPAIRPLSPFEPELRALTDALTRTGERLPLVIGTFQYGAFRRSVAYWVDDVVRPVTSMAELLGHLELWNGAYADPARWQQALRDAQAEAERQVRLLEQQATEREKRGLAAQFEAARLRLLIELGRYLICLEPDNDDLNGVLYRQMMREGTRTTWLRQSLGKLGGYPAWPENVVRASQAYARALTDNARKALLLGRQLDAALQDPRWKAASALDREFHPTVKADVKLGLS